MRRIPNTIWVSAAAGLSLVLLHHWLPSAWMSGALIVYLLIVFGAGVAILTNRKEKFTRIRNAELDVLFDRVFSDYESDLARFPFRVHVFRRCGMFPLETLTMIYSYRTHAADPDRALSFRRYFGQQGEGLVWQTCQSSDVRYFRSQDVPDAKATFHLKQSQATATREVAAILTFPLRPVTEGAAGGAAGSAGGSTAGAAPIGVLSFDALNPEAADSLGLLFAQFQAGEQPDLAALIDRISLYV